MTGQSKTMKAASEWRGVLAIIGVFIGLGAGHAHGLAKIDRNGEKIDENGKKITAAVVEVSNFNHKFLTVSQFDRMMEQHAASHHESAASEEVLGLLLQQVRDLSKEVQALTREVGMLQAEIKRGGG